jgi:K+/H+ antiporter YhaU regulatory subunit KhtT
VIAASIEKDGTMAYNPGGTSKINPGSTLIALGERESLEKLSKLIAGEQ